MSLVLRLRNGAWEVQNPSRNCFGNLHKLFYQLQKIYFQQVIYTYNFQRWCSDTAMTSPRAHILMSLSNNVQTAHTHSCLLKQWLMQPASSLCCSSVKLFDSEDKLIMVHRTTTGSLPTWNNAGSTLPHESRLLLHLQEATQGKPRPYFQTW